MRVVQLGDPATLAVRSHPWRGSASDPTHRHLDLRQHPELIRTQLEDFLPWSHFPAIETFYTLLAWLNGSTSSLETNDCALTGPIANQTAGIDKAIECSGRLMLLFRDLPQNTDDDRVHGLTQAVARALSEADEVFEWGVIGVTIAPTRFTALPGTEADKRGSQLMLSFWAWGDDELEAMRHLHRTLANVSAALREVG